MDSSLILNMPLDHLKNQSMIFLDKFFSFNRWNSLIDISFILANYSLAYQTAIEYDKRKTINFYLIIVSYSRRKENCFLLSNEWPISKTETNIVISKNENDTNSWLHAIDQLKLHHSNTSLSRIATHQQIENEGRLTDRIFCFYLGNSLLS